jgi:hypothetical protein
MVECILKPQEGPMKTLWFLLLTLGIGLQTCFAQAPCAFVEINVKHNGNPVEDTCVRLTCTDCEPPITTTVYTDQWGDAFFDMQLWPVDCSPCCPAEENAGNYTYHVYEWAFSKNFNYDGTIYEDFKNFTTNPQRACPETK